MISTVYQTEPVAVAPSEHPLPKSGAGRLNGSCGQSPGAHQHNLNLLLMVIGFDNERYGAICADHDWHQQFLPDVRHSGYNASRIVRIRVPYVIDHRGHCDGDGDGEVFATMARLEDRYNDW